MAVEQLITPGDTPFLGVAITNFEAGTTSDVITVRIHLDKGNPASGVVLKDGVVSVAVQDPSDPSNVLKTGVQPMDEFWPQIRFTGASANIDPFFTTFTRLGGFAVIPFPQMVADSFREYELRFLPSSFAKTNLYTFLVFIGASERSFALPVAGVDTFTTKGILDGSGDGRFSKLLSGFRVTAQSVPDDTIDVEAGVLKFQGVEGSDVELLGFAIDQFDSIPEELEIGEAYILMMSRLPDGTIDIEKGLRSPTPVAPDKPIDKIFQAYIRVDFVGVATAPIIVNEDITMTTVFGHYFLRVISGLTIRIHGGNMLSSGTWRTTSGVEDILLTDNDENFIWLGSDGSYTITLVNVRPDGSSDLLYHITTVAGEVTVVEDLRVFLGRNFAGDVNIDGDLSISGTVDLGIDKFRLAIPFGATLTTNGKFARANGTANIGDQVSGSTSKQPILRDGVLSLLAYNVSLGDITSQIAIHIDGIVVGTFVLSPGIFNSTGVVDLGGIVVSTGSTLEIEFDAGANLGDSTMIIELKEDS